jgi:hypothetical protein
MSVRSPTAPETVNRDRRTWLAGAIAQEMMTFSRHLTLRRLQGELRNLESEAVRAGWIARDEARSLIRDSRNLAWIA